MHLLEEDELPRHLLCLFQVHDIKGLMLDATQPDGQLPNHTIESYVWVKGMMFPAARIRDNKSGKTSHYRFNLATWLLEVIQLRLIEMR